MRARACGTSRSARTTPGSALDNFLMRHLKNVPRSRVYRLLRKGEVRVNGKRAKPEYRLAAGDKVRIPPVRLDAERPPARVPASLMETIRGAIVHEDADLLVVNKPAGVAVHGGSGLDFGVIEALRADRPRESLELAHRLDRDTSGLLLVARKRSSLRELHATHARGARGEALPRAARRKLAARVASASTCRLRRTSVRVASAW